MPFVLFESAISRVIDCVFVSICRLSIYLREENGNMDRPKRGRPPKPEGDRLVNLGIAMHPEVIAKLREVCEAHGLTQTSVVESALKREFRRIER